MGEFPEVAIFQRFGALNAQNMLYLKAELKHLEDKLRKYAKDDEASAHVDRSVYSRDWYTLKESCNELADEGNNGRQWQTILEIRKVLREYSIEIILVNKF